jgi:vacuolar-type H+-ATPase subunit D/Vma8
MTQIGKLLVVAITILAMVFLGLTTVVMITAENWKDKALAETKKLQETKQELVNAQTAVAEAAKEMTLLKQNHDGTVSQKDQMIADLESRFKDKEAEYQRVNTALSVAQENATLSSTESTTRVDETASLRTSLKSAQDQANTLKLQEKDLNQQIVSLAKQLEAARNTNERLRDEVATLSTTLSTAGLATDVRNVKALANPPAVEGLISRVDANSSHVELSIGSDDGLVPGHELFVFRRGPNAQYIGKIRIIAADPERAVATVVGKTYLGTKVTEGDVVSTSIKPRG